MRNKPIKIIFILMMSTFLIACNKGISEGVKTLEDIKALSTGKYQFISSKDAKHLIDIALFEDAIQKGLFIILDVRTVSEYNNERLPSAINIPVETIGQTKPKKLPDENAIILVYCRSGNRSKTASKQLINLGYKYVFDFGGINSWPYEKER